MTLDVRKAGFLDPKCGEGWDPKATCEPILTLDVRKAGFLDPKCEEGWDFGPFFWEVEMTFSYL